jgi:hypothetical protein
MRSNTYGQPTGASITRLDPASKPSSPAHTILARNSEQAIAGDFDAYRNDHRRAEHQRIHQGRYQDEHSLAA